MKKYLQATFLIAALIVSSEALAMNEKEYVSAVTVDTLTVTSSGLGIVKPEDLDASQIRKMQRSLTAKGFYQKNIDGKWGAQTAAAVRQFQKAYHLWAEGMITTSTVAQLGVPVEIRPMSYQAITPAAGNDDGR